MYTLEIKKIHGPESKECSIQMEFSALLFEGLRKDQLGGSFLLGGLTTDSQRIVKELFWGKINIDCSISGSNTHEKLEHAFFEFENVRSPYEVRLVVPLID